VVALESAWKDRHSCRDGDCWGFAAYPVDMFRRILAAAIEAVAKPCPVFFDAGAGIGTKVLLAARAGCEASGVEHNQHYVDEAARIGAAVTLGDVREHDYSTADIVWLNWPLRDPVEQAALQAQIARQLHPGAVLALGNAYQPPPGWEQLTSVVNRDGAWRKPKE
jgi:trans-aconitate methyltransferase